MSAFHRAEINFPFQFAFVRKGRKSELLGGAPAEIDSLRIGAWRARGKAVLLMVLVLGGFKIFTP